MSNSKRYTVKRITMRECELTYPTTEGERVVRYTRPMAGGYVYRGEQQAMQQGYRVGHTLHCGKGQDLATLIRSEVRKSLAREQQSISDNLEVTATLEEAGHP